MFQVILGKEKRKSKTMANTLNPKVREDTHKKVFFSGRTTKREGGGGKTPLRTKQKPFFSSKEKKYEQNMNH